MMMKILNQLENTSRLGRVSKISMSYPMMKIFIIDQLKNTSRLSRILNIAMSFSMMMKIRNLIKILQGQLEYLNLLPQL